MKGLVKWTAARLAGGWGRHGGPRVVVLTYHSIHPTKPFRSATPEMLDQHLGWLKQNCGVTAFSGIAEALREPDGERPVTVVTFDDGYRDNYEYAFPLLARHSVPAMFFVTAGLLEKDPRVVEKFERERGCGYEGIRPLEWSQAREMRRAGLEFGGHTWGHPNLALLSEREARADLRRGRDILEQQLGEGVRALAYPYGKPRRHFTAETIRTAREAGYRTAAAVLFRGVRSTDDDMAVPRFLVTNDSLETLEQKVLGRWDWLGLWQERAPLWAGRVVSPVDFSYR